MADEETLSLENLGNGGALELFQDELVNVLENILDPNTDAKAKRKLTLVATFSPNADRNEVGLDVQCTSKLAPLASASATVFVGRKHGQVVAITHDPRQLQLEWDEESKPTKLEDERVERDAG